MVNSQTPKFVDYKQITRQKRSWGEAEVTHIPVRLYLGPPTFSSQPSDIILLITFVRGETEMLSFVARRYIKLHINVGETLSTLYMQCYVGVENLQLAQLLVKTH